jgi:hypothetical protein
VRAREAAHDAPVRRWAKAAYSRLGATGAMAAAVAFAAVFRVVLALIALRALPLPNVADLRYVPPRPLDARAQGHCGPRSVFPPSVEMCVPCSH